VGSTGFVRLCHLRIVRGQLDWLQCELGVKIIQVHFRLQGRAERGKDLFLVQLQERDIQRELVLLEEKENMKANMQRSNEKAASTST
jgi:hypothetical protein